MAYLNHMLFNRMASNVVAKVLGKLKFLYRQGYFLNTLLRKGYV